MLFEGRLVVSALIITRQMHGFELPIFKERVVVELEVAALDVAHALAKDLVAANERYAESLV